MEDDEKKKQELLFKGVNGLEFSYEGMMDLMKKFGDYKYAPNVEVADDKVDNVVNFEEYRTRLKDDE